MIARLPLTIAEMRLIGTLMSFASRSALTADKQSSAEKQIAGEIHKHRVARQGLAHLVGHLDLGRVEPQRQHDGDAWRL